MSPLYLLERLLNNKQKAVVAGAVSGGLSLLALVGISGEMTVKEALYAAGNWAVAHGLVYLTANKKL